MENKFIKQAAEDYANNEDSCWTNDYNGFINGAKYISSIVAPFLENSRKHHYYCEDSWYSCPKNEDGCADDNAGTECNCGADEYNKELDELLSKINLFISN